MAADLDSGGEVGLHVANGPKSAAEGYRKTGAFPDGTVLVKELFNTETEDMTTGRATHAAGITGCFVMVKDEENRFSENPLCGDGWGRSFFATDNTATMPTKDYRGERLACHEPARATDPVYVQAYPVLK